MKVLLTSGGTKVKIDEVRHIGNMSRGTFGSRIGRAFLNGGFVGFDELRFMYAKDSRKPFRVEVDFADTVAFEDHVEKLARLYRQYRYSAHRYSEVEFATYDDYAQVLKEQLVEYQPDIVVLAAAVSDFVVGNYVDGKIRSQSQLDIHLEPAQKLIGEVKKILPDCKLVGFKLLVGSTQDELLAAAQKSVEDNGCDLVVANDLRDIRANQHQVLLVTADNFWLHQSKPHDPDYLAQKVAEYTMLAARGRL